jgi:hypothetical protein
MAMVTENTMPPPCWQALPPRSIFLVAAALRGPVVLPCHSCLGNMRKNNMLPFLDGELVVETYVSSCTTTSSGRLMMVAVSIIVYNGLPFLLGCSPTLEAYV